MTRKTAAIGTAEVTCDWTNDLQENETTRTKTSSRSTNRVPEKYPVMLYFSLVLI